MTPGKWLKYRRQKLKITQDELAARLQGYQLQLSRAALSAWETDRNPFPLNDVQTIRILAKALECSVVDIFIVSGYTELTSIENE